MLTFKGAGSVCYFRHPLTPLPTTVMLVSRPMLFLLRSKISSGLTKSWNSSVLTSALVDPSLEPNRERSGYGQKSFETRC
jgi:hypothetical protein